MPWPDLAETENDTPPVIVHARAKLVEAIENALKSRSELDRIEIGRRSGRRGWTGTGKGVSVPPDDPEPDPGAAADRLIELAEAHADEHGGGLYRFVLLGESQRGQPRELNKVQLDLRTGDTPESGKDTEAADLLSAARAMCDAFVVHNTKLLNSVGTMISKVESTLETARQQSQVLVDLKKLEIEHEMAKAKATIEHEEFEMRWATIRAVGTRYEDEIGEILGAWAAQMRARASENGESESEPANATKPPRTLASKLATLLEPITDDERVKLAEILGEDAWDLVVATSKAPTDDQARAILVTLGQHFKKFDRGAGMRMLQAVTELLGARGAPLLAFLQRHSGAK